MNEIQQLDGLLTEQIESLDQLIAALKEEREAIVEYDLAHLVEMFKKKNVIVLQIQSLEQQRREAVRELGIALGYDGEPSLKFLLGRFPNEIDAARIQDRLSCIRSLAQAAGEFNEVQRELIFQSLGTIQSQLSLLDQLQGREQSSCYAPDGNLVSKGSASGHATPQVV